MSNSPELPDSEPAPPPAPVGSWLAAAREAQDLTKDDVARALHLDTAIVEALEAEDFEGLGATVFAKGHLRAVAAHLGLDEDEANERFHARTGIASDAVPELVLTYNRPIKPPSRLPIYAAVAVLILILGAALVFLGMRLSLGADDDQAEAAESPALTEAQDAVEPATSFAQKLAEAEAAAGSDGELPVVPSETPPAATASAPETVSAGGAEQGLRLTFSGECWFEVTDAAGVRLAYGTASPGTDRLITGERPFAVTLGVADNVTVLLDGEPVPITPDLRRGRAARLLLP